MLTKKVVRGRAYQVKIVNEGANSFDKGHILSKAKYDKDIAKV